MTGAMRSTGLLDSAYWLSYWVHAALVSTASAALVHVTGVAFGLELFVNTEGSVLYVTLLLYSLTMCAAAFLIASLFSKVRLAALVATFLVLVCAVVAVLSGLWEQITYVWWEANFPALATGLLKLVLPPFNLVKLLADATELGASRQVLNQTTGKMSWVASGGLDWALMSNYSVNRSAAL